MKKFFLFLFLLAGLKAKADIQLAFLTNIAWHATSQAGVYAGSFAPAINPNFVVVWTTLTNNTPVTLGTDGGTCNYTVDWGDGEVDHGVTTNNQTHVYALAGSYTNTISGTMTVFSAANSLIITRIISFGETGLTSLDGAFYGCYNLTGSIPPFPAGLTSLRYAFYKCYNLTGSIPPFPVGLTSLYYTFLDCYNLTSSIPPFPVGLKSLDAAFFYCYNLTSSIPPFPAGLTSLYFAFYNCPNLTGNIPPFPVGLTSLDTAFYNCYNLTSASNTVLNIFGTNYFSNLTSLSHCFDGAKWVYGRAGDCTNLIPPTADHTAMFTGQTNLLDWATLDASYK